jgi:hypothetical protein
MRTIAAMMLVLTLAACAAPMGQRPDEWHDAPEGFGVGISRSTRRVDVGGEAILTHGLVGPRWLRLLEPEYDEVIVHSGRCVFTRRPGATTYERWRVTWPSDAAPEVDGPEPTPWSWIGELRERGAGPRPTNAVTQERDVAYGLASPDALSDREDGALPRDVPLSILDPEGEAHGRVLAREAWIWNDTVLFDAMRDGVRVTELLGLDGRRKIPPLPSVTWVNYAPAVVLDARFTGREGLVWPLDPVTTLPVSDPTRSAIGFEPVIEKTSSHVKPFWGFIKRYRTPDGQRAGWCSPDLSVDQGPVARDVVNAVENGFDGLVIERLEGGWIVCQLAHDRDGPRPANYRVVPVREVPEATADQALAACLRERREADRLAQLEAWRRDRPSTTRGSGGSRSSWRPRSPFTPSSTR